MKKGFTLIELLVVVLIIGILAAVALPQYKMAVLKSRTASMLDLGKAFAQSQERYFLEHGEYAVSVDDLDLSMPTSCTPTSTHHNAFSCGTDWLFDNAINESVPESYGALYLYYCPNNNTSWNACSPKSDFRITYIFSQLSQTPTRDPGTVDCRIKNSSALGRKLCNSFAGIMKTRE